MGCCFGQLVRLTDHQQTTLQVNLLSNAVKFTDKGEVILQATAVSTRGKNVKVEFTCRGEQPTLRSSPLTANPCDCQT